MVHIHIYTLCILHIYMYLLLIQAWLDPVLSDGATAASVVDSWRIAECFDAYCLRKCAFTLESYFIANAIELAADKTWSLARDQVQHRRRSEGDACVICNYMHILFIYIYIYICGYVHMLMLICSCL